MTGSAAPASAGIAVVIVNYESGGALVSCVESWLPEGADQVVVVDNGSTDGSVAELERRQPGVMVLATGRNLGYGAAANRGVAATIERYVLICNPDLMVASGALATLAAVLDRDEHCAMAGPLIRTPEGARYPSARRFPSLIDAAGHAVLGLVAPGNRFTRAYQLADLANLSDSAQAVDWLSGACFLVRRSAFEEVGGFDEAYFMYAEDVDLCWRLHGAGWQVSYVAAAEITHLQGVSTDAHPYRMIVEHHRSLLRFAARSTRGWRRLLLPVVAFGLAVRASIAAVDRAARR